MRSTASGGGAAEWRKPARRAQGRAAAAMAIDGCRRWRLRADAPGAQALRRKLAQALLYGFGQRAPGLGVERAFSIARTGRGQRFLVRRQRQAQHRRGLFFGQTRRQPQQQRLARLGRQRRQGLQPRRPARHSGRLTQLRRGRQQGPEARWPVGHGDAGRMLAERAHRRRQRGVAGRAVAALEFAEQSAAAFDATQKGRKRGRRGGGIVQGVGHRGTGGVLAA